MALVRLNNLKLRASSRPTGALRRLAATDKLSPISRPTTGGGKTAATGATDSELGGRPLAAKCNYCLGLLHRSDQVPDYTISSISNAPRNQSPDPGQGFPQHDMLHFQLGSAGHLLFASPNYLPLRRPGSSLRLPFHFLQTRPHFTAPRLSRTVPPSASRHQIDHHSGGRPEP